MVNYTPNDGSQALKDATVSFLDALNITNEIYGECIKKDQSEICYFREDGGYYSTGRCLLEVVGNSVAETCCGDFICGKPFVTTIDLALFVDNIFNGIDSQYSNTVSSLVTAVNGIGGLTNAAIVDGNASDTLFQDAGVSGSQPLPCFRTVEEEVHINNSNMNVDLGVLKALFGIHA